MNDLIKKVALSIGIGLVVLLATVFTSEAIFGDLTNTDSYKPLWVIAPIFLGVGGYDRNGNNYVSKLTSTNGIYNDTDRLKNAAADIVANGDAVRYNVTLIGNMTRDDIANATNGYFLNNYKLTTANYPQLSGMTCPQWRYFGEDSGQY